jgi:glycosyltransferase involved in cell wall biosynthesis
MPSVRRRSRSGARLPLSVETGASDTEDATPRASNAVQRIALVTPGFPPSFGGVEQHTGKLAAELAAAGNKVEVFTARRGLRHAHTEEREGMTVHWFPAWRAPHLSLSPRLVLSGLRIPDRFDLVHVHSYHASTGIVALQGRWRPVVFTPHFHGAGHTRLARGLHRVYDRAGSALLNSSRAIICVSTAERDLLLSRFPGLTAPVRVIPNGVEATRIRAAVRISSEPPTVLCLGRVEPYKRFDRVLDAMVAVPAPTQLVVIGDGSGREALRAHAHRLGIAARVQFLGAVDTDMVRRWLRTARVLVSLSEFEAFGIAPIEAACAGAGVVLSDIPAHREIVASYLGTAARLVAADSADTVVAGAIVEQLNITERAAVDAPDWTQAVDATIALYREVCRDR